MTQEIWWYHVSKELRPKILQRDNYTCQRCGIKYPEAGKYLHVHHIDKNRRNNDEINLIILCVSCHSKISKPFKPKKKSKLQFLKDEFIPKSKKWKIIYTILWIAEPLFMGAIMGIRLAWKLRRSQ